MSNHTFEKYEQLSTLPQFAAFTKEEFKDFMQGTLETDFISGRRIYVTGDLSLCLYIVLKGRVEVFSPLSHDDTLLTLTNGDVFGEKEFLGEVVINREANAFAVDNVTLLQIPPQLLDRFPKFKAALHKENLGGKKYFLKVISSKLLANDFYSIIMQADSALPDFQPGQYVTFEIKLGDEWFYGSYFPIKKIDERTWEFRVRREPNYIIANLLTGAHATDLKIHANKPHGNFAIKKNATPIVYFASGIGIVPALAAMNANIPDFHLYYSTNLREELASIDAKDADITKDYSPLDIERITKYLAQYPDAQIYICGPKEFNHLIYATLEELHYPQSKTKYLSFASVTARISKKSKCPFAQIKPYFNKKSTELELFLNDVYTLLGGTQAHYKLRLLTIKDEIKKLRHFVPTSDEAKAGIKQIFINHGQSIDHLYILDRRHTDVALSPVVEQIIKDHLLLLTSNPENSVITILPTNVELPNNSKIEKISLTKFCNLSALVSLAKDIVLPSPLVYQYEKPKNLIKMPKAYPGKHKWPLIGFFIRFKDLYFKPLETVKAAGIEYGQPFLLQARPDVPLYILGPKPYHDFLDMPPEIMRRGKVMLTVPAIGFWFKRSKINSEDWLQSLLLNTRSYIAEHIVGPNQLATMQPIIRDTVRQHLSKMQGEISLNDTLIPMAHDAAVAATVDPELWNDIKDQALPLLRTIVESIDTKRSGIAQFPLTKFLLPEYYATKKLERILHGITRNHQKGIKRYKYLDLLAKIKIDGNPLPDKDLAWFLLYVIWSSVSYAGTYITWTLAKILSTPGVYEDIKGRSAQARQVFLNECFIETMRIFPVSILARTTGCPVDIEIDNKTYRIPKRGWGAVTVIDMVRDPIQYPDPETWDPYRYEKGAKVPELFGSGPFSCPAVRFNHMFFTIMLSEIFNSLEIKLLSQVDWPPLRVHPIYPNKAIMLEVKQGKINKHPTQMSNEAKKILNHSIK